MPRILAVKFGPLEMPKYFMPGMVEDARAEEFVVVKDSDGDEEVVLVAAIEYRATAHLELRPTPYPDVLRRARPDEIERWWEARAFERRALIEAKERSRALNLPIKISTVRYHPEQRRLAYHFTSETRVDFRTLVKDLAAAMMVRVELWQTGIRDEAKAIDGFGICGQRTCCSTFLTEFKPIGVRMARDQEINLPPAKLTGQCGRFLCCLSYEVDQYREMSRDALPKGSTVRWRDKSGVVVDRNLVAKTYLVRDETGSLVTVKASELGGAKVEVPEQMTRFGKKLRGEETSASSDEVPPRSDELRKPTERPQQDRRPRRDAGRPPKHFEPTAPEVQERREDLTHLVPKLPAHTVNPDADLTEDSGTPATRPLDVRPENPRRPRARVPRPNAPPPQRERRTNGAQTPQRRPENPPKPDDGTTPPTEGEDRGGRRGRRRRRR